MTTGGAKHLDCVLPPTASVRQAIELMTGPSGSGIILVADRSLRLKGVVVDFDIRKSILRGKSLEAPVSTVMNPKPFTLPHDISARALERYFRKGERAYVPLVDEAGRVSGLARRSDHIVAPGERPNWIVLLAGGLGTRLHTLTQDRLPKPLVHVGDKPILETIVSQFKSAGFRRIMLAVNHHADQIRAHFGDGRRFDVEIRYIRERKRLGTAGPLSLMPSGLTEPILVMNGDLLTRVDFRAVLDFHRAERNVATVCVREFDFQVPFGVVQMEDHKLDAIVEKPTHRFFVNAGIYVLEPKALSLLDRNKHCDMPTLLSRLRKRKRRSVGCYPIREYWIDIGRLDEYKRANLEYGKVFA
jgi:dTDP-glucose pyrophosphorylase